MKILVENSEQVEAGVWVGWDARVVRVHSAVHSAIQAMRDLRDEEEQCRAERFAATLSGLRQSGIER